MVNRSESPPRDGALVDAELHVHGFRQAREARRLELVEDYLELISDLIRAGGEARQVDIAARLGVAQPTVAKMLKRLCEDGFVQQRPYRGVFLTEAGRRLAAQARERHRIVERKAGADSGAAGLYPIGTECPGSERSVTRQASAGSGVRITGLEIPRLKTLQLAAGPKGMSSFSPTSSQSR